MMLVLFLIALIGTLFVVNVGSALRDQEESTVENAFWEASREGRLQALLTRRPVVLYYDEEASAFQLVGGGAPIGTYAAAGVTRDGAPITVEFVQERPTSELVLIRGQLINTRPVEQVVFYPDGSSTSFSLELSFGAERRQIRIDPWTGVRMLME
jgi:general secretion pathway protein H